MSFDYIGKTESGIEFGVIAGGENILFIKAGLGGNFSGYLDKYLKIAKRLNEIAGFSVISASNPHDGKSHVADDRAIIDDFITRSNIKSPRLFFLGHSNGGIKGLELCASGVAFRKMLLINMPLMINFHKTKRYISSVPDTDIKMVYGELDPSFSYVPFIGGRFRNVTVSTVPGADHNFSDMLDEFIALCDFFLTQ
ncbi:MAG: hypothetical protein IIV11_02565 [Clostridia bacterium]|nr:hypothetical protein [Clostridia bacterium]